MIDRIFGFFGYFHWTVIDNQQESHLRISNQIQGISDQIQDLGEKIEKLSQANAELAGIISVLRFKIGRREDLWAALEALRSKIVRDTESDAILQRPTQGAEVRPPVGEPEQSHG